MAIPDYQSLMLPLLRLASDGGEHRFRDAVAQLASELNITDSERVESLPSVLGVLGPRFDGLGPIPTAFS
jgi:restriction system protein